MEELTARLQAHTDFSGVVRIDRPGREPMVHVSGFADRRWEVPIIASTRFGLASGAKGFTALAAWAAVDDGHWMPDTRIRDLLGDDLPLIDDRVTVHHLLTHRSGIGDYLDEDDLDGADDYVLTVAPHLLDSTEAYLAVLDGHPQREEPDTAFRYNNGGFVVLALCLERLVGERFEDYVGHRVIERAGLTDTGYDRGDALPPGVAVGYLDGDGWRTNALHLPVRGSGDGGVISTVADIRRLWIAALDGTILGPEALAGWTEPSRTADEPGKMPGYGAGVWIDADGALALEGADAGVSFRSRHDPRTDITVTVVSNTSVGAWPIVRLLRELPVS